MGRRRTATRFPGLEVLDHGNVLSDELDPELQAISADAGRELGVPMAGVVLLYEDVTYLRGFYGFAGDFARVSPRNASFCQFVVRNGEEFEVNDAAADARVPELAVQLGVSSYLGMPIVLDGKTVGSMCAIDTEPRLFDDRERTVLRALAVRASQRLALLATQPRDLERTLHDRAVRPAFGEIRNRLHPVLGNVCAMQGMVSELVLLRKQVQTATDPSEVGAIRAKADAVIAELAMCLDEMTTDTGILHRAIVAVEGASLVSNVECSIHDIIAQATTLAHHRTKLVAGVRWTGQCRDVLRVPRMVAVNALAAALAGVAESISPAAERGIEATITSKDEMAIVELRADVPSATMFALASQLAVLCGDGSLVGVDGKALQIGFEIARLS